jgi:tetratricopeptide (TPR) repeat protein
MNKPIYPSTRTLARLYADQGYHDKAIEIYNDLIQKFPGRKDIRDDLAEIKQRMQQVKTTHEPKLTLVFQEWLDLLTKYKQVRESFNNSQSRL